MRHGDILKYSEKVCKINGYDSVTIGKENEMKREKQLHDIDDKLVDIRVRVKYNNAINDYSINQILENLIRDILNCIFDYNLENANHAHPNQRGYDLIDIEHKIIIQVSSENRSTKIQHSLNRIEFSGGQNWQFYFFLLGEATENLKRKKYQIPNTIMFSPDKDIWDLTWLTKEIHNLNWEKVDEVFKILCEYPYDDILKKKDVWDAILKEYQINMRDCFSAFGQDIEWQKDRNGHIYFNILERLLPDGFVSLSGIEANGINKYGEKISLNSLLNQETYENMTIIGEGGIGKTTFLRKIMDQSYKEEVYREEKVVPIYIELSRTPEEIGTWYSSKRQKSNFIIRYIAGLVYGFEWADSSKEALECYEIIEHELQRTVVAGKEEYLLLLDGLNEVSMRTDEEGRTISDYLCMEISVMRKYRNLKIILTSRQVKSAYSESDMQIVELVGVRDEDVEWYLEKSGFMRTQINNILVNKELMACLRMPLFLCMFGSRKAEGIKTPCSRGEILYNFFHRDSPYYNEHKIAERVRDTYFGGMQTTFIVDFLLPYIGWTMEYIEYYNLEESYLEGLVEEFLQDEEKALWFEQIEPFQFYRKKHIRINDIRKELNKIPYTIILEYMTERLGILFVDHNGNGYFVHQHLRDYFAAVYEIQLLKVAYALANAYEKSKNAQVMEKCEEVLSEINENIWSEMKCCFIGEIAGESRNRPIFENGRWKKGQIDFEEQNYISMALKTFRSIKIIPVEGLYNLIETMKLTRKDLSGANFSMLDLRGCRFNGAVCSHKISGQLLAANFHGSKLGEETFLISGHKGIVLQMQLSFDGENLFTFGEDGFLIMWDSRTGKRQYSIQTGLSNHKAGGNPTKIEVIGEFEAILDKMGHLVRCNILSGSIEEYENPDRCEKITDFTYNSKTKEVVAVYEEKFVTIYSGNMRIWEDAYPRKVLCAWSISSQEMLMLVGEESNITLLVKVNRKDNVYSTIGRFHDEGTLMTDYCGATNIFAARCTEGIYILDVVSGWWNIYDISEKSHIRKLKCHQVVRERICLVLEKCYIEFDFEEQESWIVFQDERIAFPDMFQCMGDKAFFMDEFEHTYIANILTGEAKRIELSDTTLVHKLFVDQLRRHIIIVDSKQNVVVYDVVNNQMLMSTQFHRNGEFSCYYCYHEGSNRLAMAAADHYHIRVILIDLTTQQEKEIYSEITGTEIKELTFSQEGERLLIALEKELFAITIVDGKKQIIEKNEEYYIYSVDVLESNKIEVCMYYPIEFEKCEKKNVYAYRTIYQYDEIKKIYLPLLSVTLPKLSEKCGGYWAFDGKETAFYQNSQGKRGYLNRAITWNWMPKDIENEIKFIGFSDSEKFHTGKDFMVPTIVSYDTMLLVQSYENSPYRLLEYGKEGFFVKNGSVILLFSYSQKGICKVPRIIPPVRVDGGIIEVTYITWGFGGNFYSILADGKVIEINSSGEIQREFPVETGLSVVGCDFKGAVAEHDLKERLEFHGGVF